ncbi:Bax inhibitor-1/YccA family protein [Rathayibacter sp. YIM 133350]|uniref:Bax inhibitor-1/YccA family protein n=1 Tax=Rathayibacter sp. YIM 133350 TaxID=3131992 RepID=UPI00307F8EC2
MATNPAFSRNPAFSSKGTAVAPVPTASAEELQAMYSAPAASAVDTDRMTVEDTVVKSVVGFVVLIAGAVVGYLITPAAPAVFWIASIVGFVLALVNIFKREPSAPLILAYAAAQGIFLGGISLIYETQFSGIIAQAVIATLAVFGVTLALFASGKVRASKKATKIFMIALGSYVVFSLVNVVLMLTGVNKDPWGLYGAEIFGIPLGLLIGVLVVIMGAYSLVLDFDAIQQGVRNRAPRKYGWSGAFGIMVTVIWLYVEILRIIGIARSN